MSRPAVISLTSSAWAIVRCVAPGFCETAAISVHLARVKPRSFVL